MNLVQRIRNLCNSKGMTFAELERNFRVFKRTNQKMGENQTRH